MPNQLDPQEQPAGQRRDQNRGQNRAQAAAQRPMDQQIAQQMAQRIQIALQPANEGQLMDQLDDPPVPPEGSDLELIVSCNHAALRYLAEGSRPPSPRPDGDGEDIANLSDLFANKEFELELPNEMESRPLASLPDDDEDILSLKDLFANKRLKIALKPEISEKSTNNKENLRQDDLYKHIFKDNSEGAKAFSDRVNTLFAQELVSNISKVQTLRELTKEYSCCFFDDEDELITDALVNLRCSLIIASKKGPPSLYNPDVKEITARLKTLDQAISAVRSKFTDTSEGVEELNTLEAGIRKLREGAIAEALLEYKNSLDQDVTLTKEEPKLEENGSKGIGYRSPIPGMS